jgi:hypothetical protein
MKIRKGFSNDVFLIFFDENLRDIGSVLLREESTHSERKKMAQNYCGERVKYMVVWSELKAINNFSCWAEPIFTHEYKFSEYVESIRECIIKIRVNHKSKERHAMLIFKEV